MEQWCDFRRVPCMMMTKLGLELRSLCPRAVTSQHLTLCFLPVAATLMLIKGWNHCCLLLLGLLIHQWCEESLESLSGNQENENCELQLSKELAILLSSYEPCTTWRFYRSLNEEDIWQVKEGSNGFFFLFFSFCSTSFLSRCTSKMRMGRKKNNIIVMGSER